jgi:hypothetical protein
MHRRLMSYVAEHGKLYYRSKHSLGLHVFSGLLLLWMLEHRLCLRGHAVGQDLQKQI